jgi:hypothetical protein
MTNKKLLFFIILVGCGIYFYKNNDRNCVIIIGLLALYAILFNSNSIENAENVKSDKNIPPGEAIKNLSSIYNSNKMVVDNLEVLNELTVKKKINAKEAKIGGLDIRSDRIGNQKGNIDLQLRSSGWLGIMGYNKSELNPKGAWMNHVEIIKGPGGDDRTFQNYIKKGQKISLQGKIGHTYQSGGSINGHQHAGHGGDRHDFIIKDAGYRCC